MKSCWHTAPTKRPTAAEIVELLSNNPRLISPCIDVPMASVQVERTDSIELIPPGVLRKSGSMSQRPSNLKIGSGGSARRKDNSAGGSIGIESGPYSPMNGVPNGAPPPHYAKYVPPQADPPFLQPPKQNGTCWTPRPSSSNGGGGGRGSSNGDVLNHDGDDELGDSSTLDAADPDADAEGDNDALGSCSEKTSLLLGASASAYVPPGYIILDHRGPLDLDANDYVPTTVSSV